MGEKNISIEAKTARLILGDLLSADPTWRKLKIINEHIKNLSAEIKMEERKRCAHDIIEQEGETIEKSTAVMLCMIDS